ncbi:uncharacterized protein LOC131623792 [Vicia villosa]|uniref:uncharacterized protein LOC131623792 n=1 Tax=Vicia villosa TaxID=3911 RepID=UPI00273BD65C|nr:uncharacterized protein LOC131623792 [Vicia villosa]
MYSNPPMDYAYHTPSSHQWSIPPTYSTPTPTPSFPSFPWELFTPYYTHGSSSPKFYLNHGYSPHTPTSYPPPPNSYSSSHYPFYYNNHHQPLQSTKTYHTFTQHHPMNTSTHMGSYYQEATNQFHYPEISPVKQKSCKLSNLRFSSLLSVKTDKHKRGKRRTITRKEKRAYEPKTHTRFSTALLTISPEPQMLDSNTEPPDNNDPTVDDYNEAHEIVELNSVELLAKHLHFCEICGKGFKRDANLRLHLRTHTKSSPNVSATLALQHQFLSQRFRNTRSPAPNPPCQAESSLCEAANTPNFGLVVLRLIAEPAVDAQIRQSTAVNFKNHLRLRWELEESSILEAEKEHIKTLSVSLMLVVSPKTQSQLSEALAISGNHDFPKAWPTFLAELVTNLQNASQVNEYTSINDILSTVDSIFGKFRVQFHSSDIWIDSKYCLDNFAAHLLETLLKTASLIDVAAMAAPPLTIVTIIPTRYPASRLFTNIIFSVSYLMYLMEFELMNLSPDLANILLTVNLVFDPGPHQLWQRCFGDGVRWMKDCMTLMEDTRNSTNSMFRIVVDFVFSSFFDTNTYCSKSMFYNIVRGSLTMLKTTQIREKVLVSAKHYISDDGTIDGIDESYTVIDRNELMEIHIPSYLSSISKGVATVMVSDSSWNDRITTPHRVNCTDLFQARVFAGVYRFMVPNFFKNFINVLTVLAKNEFLYLHETEIFPANLASLVDAMSVFLLIVFLSRVSLRKILLIGEFEEYPDENRMHCTARLVDMLNSFANEFQNCDESNSTRDFLMDEIKVLEEAKCITLPNFMPRTAVLILLQRKLQVCTPRAAEHLISKKKRLQQELDVAREKLKHLQTDVKLLVKEVKSLRSSQLELKQQLDELKEENISAGSLELMEHRHYKNMTQFLASSAENGWQVLGGSVSSKEISLNEIEPGPPTILVLEP